MSLTEEGLELINRVVTAHTENQSRLVASLSHDEQQALNQLLRTFLNALET